MYAAMIVLVLLAVSILALLGFMYFIPEKALLLSLKLQRARAGLVRKEIQLPEGLQYVYLEGGDGEPLMLLHGLGADKDTLDLVAASLTAHYRVIIPDITGFGESARPADADYSPAAQAMRLRTFAHTLGIQKIHLGGSSMGGHLAMTYAALYPDEVKSLWLQDPGGVWSAPKTAAIASIDKTGENPLLIGKEDDLIKLFRLITYKPLYIPRPMLNVMARRRIENYTLEKRIFEELSADSMEQRVNGLKTPTLIVWGKEDRVIDVKSADILSQLLPNSQVMVMDGIGHAPVLENPKQSAQDYLKFRASLNP